MGANDEERPLTGRACWPGPSCQNGVCTGEAGKQGPSGIEEFQAHNYVTAEEVVDFGVSSRKPLLASAIVLLVPERTAFTML